MMGAPDKDTWSRQLYDDLVGAGVTLFTYVPDAGNAKLMEIASADAAATAVLLTTEEEGIAVCAGADLVGKTGIVCTQSSGLGNCVNFLSFVKGARFPLLMLISMRGDYGEENPWQYPMGQAVEPILKAMGVLMFKVDGMDELGPATRAATATALSGHQAAAIVLSQKFLGAKAFPA